MQIERGRGMASSRATRFSLMPRRPHPPFFVAQHSRRPGSPPGRQLPRDEDHGRCDAATRKALASARPRATSTTELVDIGDFVLGFRPEAPTLGVIRPLHPRAAWRSARRNSQPCQGALVCCDLTNSPHQPVGSNASRAALKIPAEAPVRIDISGVSVSDRDSVGAPAFS